MSLTIFRRRPGGTCYIRGTVGANPKIRVYEATGTADAKLAKLYRAKREAQLYEASLYGPRAVVSFEQAALSYLEFEERSDRTKFDIARVVDHFDRFGVSLLRHINQDAADAAVAGIVGKDAAPATKRRAVYAPLTAILNHAHARGWCDRPGFQMPALPRGKTRWLTPAEALRLVDAAAPHLRPLLLFILCTGARLSEALYLDWADVDLPAAKAVFRDTKNGTDRAAALPEAAVLLLANLPTECCGGVESRHATSRVVDGDRSLEMGAKVGLTPAQSAGKQAPGCVRNDRPSVRKDGIGAAGRRHNSHDAGSQAGVASGPQQRTGAVFRTDDGSPYADTGRQFGGQIKTGFRGARVRAQLREVTPHTLRHTWATWFWSVSKDLMLLKHEGGWQSVEMLERYTHLMQSHLVPEIRRVWGDTHPRLGRLPGAPAEQRDARAV